MTPLKELLTSYPAHHAGEALGVAPSGHVRHIAPVARQASARKALREAAVPGGVSKGKSAEFVSQTTSLAI